MTVARTRSVALVGVVGHLVEVEADIGRGLPAFTLVGLPDTTLSESRDRIRAAVLNSGEPWPQHRITVNLSPASLRKTGSAFDLALACCVLAASGRLEPAAVARRVLLGELGLDGRVRPVRGVLPAVLAALAAGWHDLVVPVANLAEASIVPEVRAVAVSHLGELLAVLRGEDPAGDWDVDEPSGAPVETGAAGPVRPPLDLADVAGQAEARFALEVAAAGGHHLLLHGPPGGGKTMLAERLPTVLPPLTRAEALEVTAIHSVAGELPPGSPLVTTAPFRAPHHTSSAAAVVGGGTGVARPGAVSLAHARVQQQPIPEGHRGQLLEPPERARLGDRD
jgi:magnesium chelatase family protein